MDNTAWMMGDEIVRLGVGFLVGVWLARYLGPALYGQFSYALAYVALLSPIAMLGLDYIVIREVVQNPSSQNQVLGTSFVLMAAGGATVFALATAGVLFLRPNDTPTLWLVGITAAGTVFQAFIAIEFWFEANLQWKYTAFGKVSAFLLTSLGKIVLILMQAPLVFFAWANLAEIALASVGLVLVYRLQGRRVSAWRFSTGMAGRLLKDSWPLVFTAFMTMISLRIDQVMLGQMIGNEEVGIYSAAVRLSEPWFFIAVAICSSAFPLIVKSGIDDEELFYSQLQKLYNLMALIAFLIAVPVALFSRSIVEVLFDSAYLRAGPLLAILIWAGIFTSLGAARNIFMISRNWNRLNLICISLGCILNVGLNYFLIPLYGATGAVVASCFSYWFTVHGTCFLFKPLRRTGWMLLRAMIFPKVW